MQRLPLAPRALWRLGRRGSAALLVVTRALACGRGGVADLLHRSHDSKGRQLVAAGLAAYAEMEHAPAADQQRVADQAPVTAPPLRLGAHQAGAALASARLQMVQCAAEAVAAHVVGITAKGAMLPAGVGRVGPRTAEAAEPWLVHVGDPASGQGGRQRPGRKVWMTPRARNAADVDECSHVSRAQELREPL